MQVATPTQAETTLCFKVKEVIGVTLAGLARRGGSLRLLRHSQPMTMPPIDDLSLMSIINDNMLHFAYVNDLSVLHMREVLYKSRDKVCLHLLL